MTNLEIVQAYIAAYEAKDTERLAELTAPDIAYHNVPMPVVHGKEAFIKGAAGFIRQMDDIRWETLHIAQSADGSVLTERVDNFVMKDGRRISIRCMGIFELRDGLVSRWSDYFDLAEYKAQLPPEWADKLP